NYVLPDDIKYLFPYIAEHRLILNYDSEINGIYRTDIINSILEQVRVPVEGVIDE
ncbi:MAG: AAA family ATPase, partial [Halanaerobiaceae bacterium]